MLLSCWKIFLIIEICRCRKQLISTWQSQNVVCLCGKSSSTLAAAAAKSLQSCPTLCDPIDGSPPGSPSPRSLQARTLEWGAISFSNALKWKVKVKSLSHVWLFATPWTAAYQALPSMGFSSQECWSGVPLPSPQYPSIFYQILWIRTVHLYNTQMTQKPNKITKKKKKPAKYSQYELMSTQLRMYSLPH